MVSTCITRYDCKWFGRPKFHI